MPISFEIIEPIVEVKEGDDAVVPCEVYGLPEPTINWYYDGDNLGDLLLSKFVKKIKFKICLQSFEKEMKNESSV